MKLAQPFPLQAPAPTAGRPAALRPYAVTGAHLTPAGPPREPGAVAPLPVYDPVTQTAAFADGTPLITMSTSQKTNPRRRPEKPAAARRGRRPRGVRVTATALVVDRPHDGATDLIVNALAAVGVPVFRFDMADFPLSLHLDARHEETDGWTGVLETDHRAVELADIGAVYWNRPDHFVLPAMSPADEHYSRGAARHGLGGVLAGLPVAWMNHPNRARRSSSPTSSARPAPPACTPPEP